jgi:hypothetical protein
MRRSNVLPFPTDNPSGNSLKAFAILFYLLLAYMLFNPLPFISRGFVLSAAMGLSVSPEGLGLIIILGMLYAVGVRYKNQVQMFLKGRKVLLIVLVILLILSVLNYLPFLLLLSACYWFTIGRNGRDIPYFLRFHLLTAMIFNGLMLISLLLIQSFMGLIGALLTISGLGAITSLMFWYHAFWPSVALLAFWLPALWLSLSALMGRTPYIGIVTNNVRSWA